MGQSFGVKDIAQCAQVPATEKYVDIVQCSPGNVTLQIQSSQETVSDAHNSTNEQKIKGQENNLENVETVNNEGRAVFE